VNLNKKLGLSAIGAAALLFSLTACGADTSAADLQDGSVTSPTARKSSSRQEGPTAHHERQRGTSAVRLGAAGIFTILSKSGITDVYASAITGNVGTSPITGAALLLTCGEVTGTIYVVDAAGPLPCAVNDATTLTAAVGDMEFAYLEAEGRTSPNFTELGAGEIGGLTLVPGLYKWGTGVLISSDVTLSGGPRDVWVFQVAGTLNQASATRVTLTGGALAKNVFWQVAGAVTIGTTAHFEGVVLAKTLIAVNTGASVNGRLLAQTAVTLEMNAVTQPAR
jgi:Ice-binding-like